MTKYTTNESNSNQELLTHFHKSQFFLQEYWKYHAVSQYLGLTNDTIY